MIELHGWLSVWATYENEDLLPQEMIDEVMRNVKKVIENNTCGIKLQYENGIPFVNTLFCSNHHTSKVDEIIKAYKNISGIATGSYGMLYLRDDEDNEHYNEFQVYVFKKGSCTYYIDTDFSPCIPTIEDDINFT